MLEIGNGGMSDIEYRAQFSLWAVIVAPLIAGNDIAQMSDATRSILLNREVIAVDQDSLGRAGHRVRKDGPLEVWARPLADGGRAVVLFNRGEQPAEITANWTDLGFPSTVALKLRDLWAHKPLGNATGHFTAKVAAHGVVMVKLD
jgi:alpha-galactosidase